MDILEAEFPFAGFEFFDVSLTKTYDIKLFLDAEKLSGTEFWSRFRGPVISKGSGSVLFKASYGSYWLLTNRSFGIDPLTPYIQMNARDNAAPVRIYRLSTTREV